MRLFFSLNNSNIATGLTLVVPVTIYSLNSATQQKLNYNFIEKAIYIVDGAVPPQGLTALLQQILELQP